MKKCLLSALAVGLCITTNLFAQVPNYIPTNGLVGYWPFNGNANDASGNGNNGTVNGATLTIDRNNEADKAYYFDGNSYMICPNNNIPTQNISISVWVFQEITFDNLQFICLGNSSNTSWGCIASNNNQYLAYGAGCGGIGGQSLNSIALSLNNWIHLTFVSNGINGNTKIYKNGQYIGQSLNSTSVGNCSMQNLYFGVDIFSLPEYIKGKLDDIVIWNRALTQEEITSLYNGCSGSTITSQPTNLVINPTNSAQFTVNSNSSSSYQWQTNLGFGFQNLGNAGQYSGANDDTLVVSNASVSNNNQQFRCIVNSGSCADTSDIALLTVSTVGVEEIIGQTNITLYPNPTQSSFEIQTNLVLNKIEILDMQGRLVKTENAGKTITIASLQKGTYLVRLIDEKFKVIAVQRIIKE